MKLLEQVTLYKNHGSAVGTWTIRAYGNLERGVVEISHAKVIGGKEVTREYDVERKNIGRSNETTFMMQAVYELESRVKKQLDKGYVHTLEEAQAPAVNSLGLAKPMLATPIEKVKPEKVDWLSAYAQPKLDGHRCMVNGILYSRQGKEILLPHIREALGDYGLLDKQLDGELYVHGLMLQEIGSLVKKPREESKQLRLYVYDIVNPAPYRERVQILADLLYQAGKDEDCPVVPHDTFRVRSRNELDDLHKLWLSEGYEGSMLRHGEAGYEDDKRSQSLLKVKDFEDAEFEVVGVERGKPNAGCEVPVWICRNPAGRTEAAQQFRVTAHGDMHEKHEQWVRREALIGKQLTVQFFGRSKDGVPLLPVALRWREDV